VNTSDLDLREHKHNDAASNVNSFLQQVGLNVGADLTDNVSTYVRILNEREWSAEDQNNGGEFSLLLDEGYVTLKEMLYAPLTVKIGRQNIWLGKGFVVGNAGVSVWDPESALPADVRELSEMTAFDALRATLDYDPWTIDLIYSKIDANNINRSDDVDLYVANVGYKFTKYDAEAEAYYILKHDKTGRDATANAYKANTIDTVGLRGSLVPVENLSFWAEGALQFGKYRTSALRKSDRDAAAADVGADYTFADVKWTPKVGAEYTFYSGEEPSSSGDWEAWDPLYIGKFDNYIAPFRNITKLTDYDVANGVSANGDNNGVTNESQISAFASIVPMTDLKIEARYTYLWFDKVPVANRSDKLGQEIDGKITYDYTEDVSFAVAGGVFSPGAYYPTDYDATATQLVTSVKVDF
jgi:hypothetical protein